MQWLQVGILGLKMQEHADEHNNGDLPENLLVIAPADQSAIIHKLGEVTQNPNILSDVAFAEIGEDGYMRDQYMHAYAVNLQEGNIKLSAPN